MIRPLLAALALTLAGTAAAQQLPAVAAQQLPVAAAQQLPAVAAQQLPVATAQQLPAAAAQQFPVITAQQLPAAASQQLPVATATHLQSDAEALTQDAGEYARAMAVPLAEAERRLRAQQDSVVITDAIARRYRDRLVGMSIEHQPDYRVVVLLTGDDPVPDQLVTVGGMSLPIVFRTGARATRAQLVAAIRQRQADIRAALPHPPGLGVDLATGTLVVVASGNDMAALGADLLAQRFADLTGVPVRVTAIEQPALNLAALDPVDPADPALPPAVEGGARLVGVNPLDGRRYACTAGFVVTDGTRTAIATAAHCPDNVSLVDAGRELPLSFVGQWGWGFQDVQVNASDVPLAPFFYADTAKTLARAVTYRRSAAGTRAGEWVCHRGERTGYSCSTVQLVDFAPAGDLCGGACTPNWITAAGPTCKAGDSGAPVFTGTGAVGIVKGGSYRADGTCAFYFYMSTDYLPEGWSLLQAAPSGMGAAPSGTGTLPLSGPISRSYSASGTP